MTSNIVPSRLMAANGPSSTFVQASSAEGALSAKESEGEQRLKPRRHTFWRPIDNIQTCYFEISFQEIDQLIKSTISNVDVTQAPMIRVESDHLFILGTRLHGLLFNQLYRVSDSTTWYTVMDLSVAGCHTIVL